MKKNMFLLLSLARLTQVVKCQMSVDVTMGLIFGLVFGVPVFIVVLFCLVRHFCSTRRQLKKQYNVVDSTSMTSQQFENNQRLIIDALKENKKNFAYFHKKQPYQISVNFMETTFKKPFLTKVNISARDHIGAWTSQGYILCRNKQMFFWMLKDYIDKKAAKQTGKRKYLVYQSTSFDNGRGVMEGNWFYQGFERDLEHSGKWRLIFGPSQNSPVNLMSENVTKLLENHPPPLN